MAVRPSAPTNGSLGDSMLILSPPPVQRTSVETPPFCRFSCTKRIRPSPVTPAIRPSSRCDFPPGRDVPDQAGGGPPLRGGKDGRKTA